MLAVTLEAGLCSCLAAAIRSSAVGTDVGAHREGRGVLGGPLCPQLSEPANDSSQGGCWKRAGKLKQTLLLVLLHVWLRAAIQTEWSGTRTSAMFIDDVHNNK